MREIFRSCVLAVLAVVGVCAVCAWGTFIILDQRGGRPGNIAIAPDGRAYINDYGSSSFSEVWPFRRSCTWVVDTNRDRLQGVLKTKNEQIISAAPNNKAYNFGGDGLSLSIEVISAGGTAVNELYFRKMYDDPDYVGYRANGNMVTLDIGGDRMGIFDTSTDAFIATFHITASAYSMAIASNDRVYVTGGERTWTDSDYDHIWIMDLDTSRIVGEIEHLPLDTFHDPMVSGDRVYFMYTGKDGRSLLIIDRVRDQYVESLDLPIPKDVAIINPIVVPGGKLYFLTIGPKPDCKYQVWVVDEQTATVVRAIDLGREPFITSTTLELGDARMALAPNGKVYVVYGSRHWSDMPAPSLSTGTGLYVIDPQQDQVVDFIAFDRPLWLYLFPL